MTETAFGYPRWKLSVGNNEATTKALEALNELLDKKKFKIHGRLRHGNKEHKVLALISAVGELYNYQLSGEVHRHELIDALILPLTPTLSTGVLRIPLEGAIVTVLPSAAHIYVPRAHGVLKYHLFGLRPAS